MHLAKSLVAEGGSVGYASESCVYHLHHEKWSQVQRRFEREALALRNHTFNNTAARCNPVFSQSSHR